jgi:YaiO family outer membrane protein
VTLNDFAVRINRKVGKTSAVSASVWADPRDDDAAATFQIGATGALSQRSSVWFNFGGSPTSEHVPNSQYDFGGSYGLDQQLIMTGMVSVRNYQGGPSVTLLAPGVVWVVNPKVILVATAVRASVSRLAPGVTAGSNLALFNFVWNASPKFTLNIGSGYGESDFLAAVAPTTSFAENNASANFDVFATWRFAATHGLRAAYWLDNGNGRYKTNSFQASIFFDF